MKIHFKVSIRAIAFFTILNFVAQATEKPTHAYSEDLHTRILKQLSAHGITPEKVHSICQNTQREEREKQEKEQEKELEEVRNVK
jgi:hypothetical protein